MDSATTTAVCGLAGTVTVALIAAYVAIFTNKSEKITTSEKTLESTLRERITLKDEQLDERDEKIEDLEGDLAVAESKVSKLEAQLAITNLEVERLRKNGH